MFRRGIEEGEALLFDFKRETRLFSSVHTLLVFFPIALIWLDSEGVVVDKRIAKPFRPFIAPRRRARYLLECHPNFFGRVEIGERLLWTETTSS
jgi:uncharacterized membrane protein (UPF0127 family)